MILKYFTLALRHLAKYRRYTAINICGLALGQCVFLFGLIVVVYEYDHDSMFARRDSIYILGSVFAEAAEEPVSEYPVVRTAYGPLLERELPEVTVARALHGETLVRAGDIREYDSVRFVDPAFLRIFDFVYLHGDAGALDDPRGVILTDVAAEHYFGRRDVIGESVFLEGSHELRVQAVIRYVGRDSHFNSSLIPVTELRFIAGLAPLAATSDIDPGGDWIDLDPADMTYILLPPGRTPDWLTEEVNRIAARYAPEEERKYIDRLHVRPLVDANILIWDALGFPVLESVVLLGLLVLLVACVNYANLAAAQSLTRTREVGLRKTFGAGRGTLFAQFLAESLSLAVLALLLAFAAVEILIPFYNQWTARAVRIDYARVVPALLLLSVLVGLLSGAYPAYLIARLGPLDGLRETFLENRGGRFLRGAMVAAQFAVSIFILSLVLIVYFQNRRVLAISETWPRDRVIVLNRVDVPGIIEHHAELLDEFARIPGVISVTASGGVPFYETSRTQESREVASAPDGSGGVFTMDLVSVGSGFLETFEIELLAGRGLDPVRPEDLFGDDRETVNLVINELTARRLGFAADESIIGRTFYKLPGDRDPARRIYRIVGLMPDRYFIGPQSRIRPLAFYSRPAAHYYISLLIDEDAAGDTLAMFARIDAVWSRVVSEYPIRRSMLSSFFQLFYRILSMINGLIAGFALVALVLALIGLWGLAAFMARRRTREIGIRKVLGASGRQIFLLLLGGFARPVLASLVVSLPAAHLASGVYLDFFPERITWVLPLILLAAFVAVLSAWAVVAGHALRVARMNPAEALRYE